MPTVRLLTISLNGLVMAQVYRILKRRSKMIFFIATVCEAVEGSHSISCSFEFHFVRSTAKEVPTTRLHEVRIIDSRRNHGV